MKLSEKAIQAAKPKDKDYKLSDGGGLALVVRASGGKLWWLRYRFGDKEKTLSLGKYPVLSLKDARDRAHEARKALSAGIDPSAAKQAVKLAILEKEVEKENEIESTFEFITKEWIENHLSRKATSTRTKVTSRLDRFVLPFIGKRPVYEITAPEILKISRRVQQANSLDTAHRVQQEIGQILRYAVQTGKATSDPTQSLKGALPPIEQTHFAAPAGDPSAIGDLLRVLDSFRGTQQVFAAIRLLPMLFCRPGELRLMRWSDVDFKDNEWRYTATKTKTPHIVPLPKQAMEILDDLRFLTGSGEFVFSGGRSATRPMSGAAINAGYRRLGIDTKNELTGHGWRSVARTMLHERLGFAPDIIERQLAHAVKDLNGTAYNRTQFLQQRRQMMQRWTDYLDELKNGVQRIDLRP